MSRELQPQSTQIAQTVAGVSAALQAETDLHTVILYGSGAAGCLRSGGDYASDVAGPAPLQLARRLSLMSAVSRGTDRPEFIAEKAIEMYDFQLFLAPRSSPPTARSPWSRTPRRTPTAPSCCPSPTCSYRWVSRRWTW
jgi:hypothetical protein